MNNDELEKKTITTIKSLVYKKGFVAPVDLLIELGILSQTDYEAWRFSKVPFLERVCKGSLSKLSFISKTLRNYALNNQLKPSPTAYNQYGTEGKKIRLIFSKSQISGIEKAYSTHYISPKRIEELKSKTVTVKKVEPNE